MFSNVWNWSNKLYSVYNSKFLFVSVSNVATGTDVTKGLPAHSWTSWDFVTAAMTTGVTTTTYKTETWLEYIAYASVPVLCVGGTTGNMLSLAVMRTKYYRQLPVSQVITALALSDTGMLLMTPLNKMFVRDLIGVDIRSMSGITCLVFFWMFRTWKMTAAWLVVLLCGERLVAVWLPLKVASINTNRNISICIITIYVIIGTYDLIWASFSDKLIHGTCVPNAATGENAHVTTWLMPIGVNVYSVIPCIALIVMTTLIVLKLTILSPYTLSEASPSFRNSIRITIMLLAVAIAFFCLVVPVGVSHLVTFLWKTSLFESNSPEVKTFREITQFMELLNHSINFYLYGIFSSSFRKQLIEMFTCMKNNRQVSKTSSTKMKDFTINKY